MQFYRIVILHFVTFNNNSRQIWLWSFHNANLSISLAVFLIRFDMMSLVVTLIFISNFMQTIRVSFNRIRIVSDLEMFSRLACWIWNFIRFLNKNSITKNYNDFSEHVFSFLDKKYGMNCELTRRLIIKKRLVIFHDVEHCATVCESKSKVKRFSC